MLRLVRSLPIAMVAVVCAMATGLAQPHPAASADSPFSYVALGDSYSAGEGIDPYFRDGYDPNTGQQGVIDNRCHRSSRGYPAWVTLPGASKTLYALASGGGKPGSFRGTNKYGSDANVRSSGGVSWADWACSGATTENVLPASEGGKPQRGGGQHWDLRTQIDSAAGQLASANLVTLTIGGNDVGFSSVLQYCALHDCNQPSYVQAREKLIDDVEPKLEKVYRALATAAPRAQILVLGYPEPFPVSQAEQSCAGLSLFLGEQNMLRSLGTRLNQTIQKAVAEVSNSRLVFVPVAGRFAGHEVCGNNGAWLNGISKTIKPDRWFKDDESFHPTLRGQQDGYAAAVDAAIAPTGTSIPAALANPGTKGGVDLASNPIVLVVDISGSMGDDDGTGKIKIDGAKLALLNFLQQVEPGTPIGLRTYPDQSGGSCNTGTVRFPIAPRDPATMSAVVRSLEPDGDTPTAEAMRAAANDLKNAGYTHGTLVIVSDGESTCASPCDAARAIAKSGIDLQTITVGFRISPAGQKELQCIANAMNGTYVDASDSAGLKKALANVSRPTLTVQLKYPTNVVAEVGDDPRGLVDVTGEITNTANQLARNVVTTMHFDGLSPGLTRPVLYLGNLDPGASRTVSWAFRPGLLLAGSSVSFSVSARADNTLSDGTANGSISVEDVDSAAQAGPILRDRHRLAILGDSYSSGEGADSYIAGTDTPSDGCHRSELTYLVGVFKQPDSSVVACSGAVVNDIFFTNSANHVPSQLDQLDHLETTRGVDAVVMTLGGNNALFSHLAVSCLLLNCTKTIVANFSTPWDHVSDSEFLATELNSDLRDSLTDVYTDVSSVLNSKSAVRTRGSVAPILVLGYVSPIPLTGRSCLGYLDQLTRGETAFIGQFVTTLNGLIEAAVDSARQRNVPVFYVPNTEDAFQPDHTICDAHPYARGLASFNGAGTDVTSLAIPWTRIPALEQLLNRGKQELLHPNVQGYAAETNAIIRWSLSPQARADAAWLKTAEAAQVPALPIRTSNDDLGQLAPGTSPVLQGGTSYPLNIDGFAPDSNVDVVVRSQPLLLVETQADATGSVRTRVGLPPGLPGGRHTLQVRGEAPDGRHSRTVNISFRIANARAPLALRGAEFAAAAAAFIALLAWVGLAVAKRRDERSRAGERAIGA